MTYLSTPSVLISTATSPLLSGTAYLDIGTRLPLSGVDLDRYSTFRSKLQRWDRMPEHAWDGVAAVWIPADAPVIEPMSGSSEALPVLSSRRSPLLIIDRPDRRQRDDLAAQMAAAIRLRQTLDDGSRIAVSIRPNHPNGVRAHLSQIAGLRMQASEWDIDLALDLSREIDWLWEAEAAIYRLMPSLKLLRVRTAVGTLDGRFRASLTDRALASCAELGFDGAISLVAPVPWWHWRNERTIEASSREAAGRVMRRFARIASTGEYSAELSSPVEFE